jgi:serine/threonine protein kinase
MKFLSDKTLDRLRDVADAPDLEGTRYSLGERLARGGMGVVYAAMDEKLGRRVALKVLDAPDQSGQLARRLIREAQVLAQLEHPGIVPVHDVGTLRDARVFYTMKFVEGRRLDEHVRTVPSTPDRLRLFLRICEAVASAHARGVLHRDLKPANVMIGLFGEVLVLDWGLAKLLHEPVGDGAISNGDRGTLLTSAAASAGNGADTTEHSAVTGQGAVMGTPGFMSPEQARGENNRVDERSDIFSLGAVLRFLISGDSNDTTGVGTLDKSLEAVCSKALAAEPVDRYTSALELSRDIERYLDGLSVSARKETALDTLLRFWKKHNVAILLILAYLLMRIVLLVIAKH